MQKSNIQQDDLIRLQHMLDAAQEAIDFTVGKNRIDHLAELKAEEAG